jgi:glycosyltransferase involved in cell wall biosynthesis
VRIAFDGTTLRPGRTGVGYYTEHLLHHLATESGGAHEIVVISNRPIQTTRPLPAWVRVTGITNIPFRLPWLQFVAPRLLDLIDPDVVHFTNQVMPLASPVPTVVTIHDMSLRLFPGYHPWKRVLLNRPLITQAARRAAAVIAVSSSARRDIIRFCDIPPERVHVVHEAAAPAFAPVTDRARLETVRRRYALPDRFLLYVGTIEPRKNLPRLIEAYGRRHRAGDLPWPLVCVGRYGWRARDVEARVEQLGLTGQVRFVGYVPFEDLPAIYSLADLFVFPSLHEGFGLPVVEAMACGAPAVVGDNSSLAEIASGAAETVDVTDVAAIGDALVALMASRERREELARRGLGRARQFSWRRAARETLDVYRWAAGRTDRAPALEPRPAAASGGLGLEELTSRRAATNEQMTPWR